MLVLKSFTIKILFYFVIKRQSFNLKYFVYFQVQEKLEMLTLYLRKTYLYCVWCGYSFEDEKDLQQDCPGPTKDDH